MRRYIVFVVLLALFSSLYYSAMADSARFSHMNVMLSSDSLGSIYVEQGVTDPAGVSSVTFDFLSTDGTEVRVPGIPQQGGYNWTAKAYLTNLIVTWSVTAIELSKDGNTYTSDASNKFTLLMQLPSAPSASPLAIPQSPPQVAVPHDLFPTLFGDDLTGLANVAEGSVEPFSNNVGCLTTSSCDNSVQVLVQVSNGSIPKVAAIFANKGIDSREQSIMQQAAPALIQETIKAGVVGIISGVGGAEGMSEAWFNSLRTALYNASQNNWLGNSILYVQGPTPLVTPTPWGPSPSPTPTSSLTPLSPTKKKSSSLLTWQCVKGKTVIKSSGTVLACPKGYKIKN